MPDGKGDLTEREIENLRPSLKELIDERCKGCQDKLADQRAEIRELRQELRVLQDIRIAVNAKANQGTVIVAYIMAGISLIIDALWLSKVLH
jgi:hypothetical protein